VLPLYINIGPRSYLDGVEMSREQFYDGLPTFDHHPTTAAPGAETFIALYERLAAQGVTEIVSIHIGQALSAVVNVARLAAARVRGARVEVVDSGNLSLGVGVDGAGRRAGRPSGQVAGRCTSHRARDRIPRTYCFAALDTVDYLRRSGRMNHVMWSLATILRIKPLLKMNDGVTATEKIRTLRAAYARLIELVRELGPLEELTLVHTHALDKARALYNQARALFPSAAEPLYATVTPVIGAHIGPGAVGLVAVRK
jgi:DegV family protein with EDD domain